ncbi:ATP-binding protein [Streptomyces sp. NPDC096176]|uniref:ATP-binding protein n=1 Tax=Streptomyces sp. NPDC096176 TaxID=3366079 RepID=UPI00381D2DC7
MVAGPRKYDRSRPSTEVGEDLTAHFDGDIDDVTGSRLAAGVALEALARRDPPSCPQSHGDILLVVTELAANAVQYAPGPFVLRMRRTFDGLHVTVRDTSPRPPVPRPCDPARGTGGLGWHLIQALSRQVSVLHDPGGKEIHAFLPW